MVDIIISRRVVFSISWSLFELRNLNLELSLLRFWSLVIKSLVIGVAEFGTLNFEPRTWCIGVLVICVLGLCLLVYRTTLN